MSLTAVSDFSYYGLFDSLRLAKKYRIHDRTVKPMKIKTKLSLYCSAKRYKYIKLALATVNETDINNKSFGEAFWNNIVQISLHCSRFIFHS